MQRNTQGAITFVPIQQQVLLILIYGFILELVYFRYEKTFVQLMCDWDASDLNWKFWVCMKSKSRLTSESLYTNLHKPPREREDTKDFHN